MKKQLSGFASSSISNKALLLVFEIAQEMPGNKKSFCKNTGLLYHATCMKIKCTQILKILILLLAKKIYSVEFELLAARKK